MAESPGLPDLVVHADWGKAPKKRWMAEARLLEGGRYRAERSRPVPHPEAWTKKLLVAAERSAAVLVGFDFPIGVPRRYADRVGIRDFRELLPELGSGRWRRFFEVAERPDEIGFERPFYPNRPGGTSQAHLTNALAMSEIDELRRRCERRQPERNAACPLFWTLGGQQVGKAAISGWQEVLIPMLRRQPDRVLLWPFDGSLEEILRPGRVVIAETYPAEFYSHLGVAFSRSRPGKRSGKRVRPERERNVSVLLGWLRETGNEATVELEEEIRTGFGCAADGEDRFDAVVGLLGMLNVLSGRRATGEPPDLDVTSIEGWILGQYGDR